MILITTPLTSIYHTAIWSTHRRVCQPLLACTDATLHILLATIYTILHLCYLVLTLPLHMCIPWVLSWCCHAEINRKKEWRCISESSYPSVDIYTQRNKHNVVNIRGWFWIHLTECWIQDFNLTLITALH